MIDKNGKVFGKINIIDLLVVLLAVVFAIVFAVSKIDVKEEGEVVETTNVVMEFTADEVYNYVTEHLEVGQVLYDADHSHKLGTVKSFKTGPSVSFATTSDGKNVLSPKEGFSSVVIECDVEGAVKKDFGFEVEDVKYSVGHTMTIRAGMAKIYLKISDITFEE